MSEAERPKPIHSAGIHIQRARDVTLTAGGDIVAGNKSTIHNYFGPRPRDISKAPYKFLSYYDIGDRDIFFGREAVVDEIAGEVARHRILIINGQSGSGKTSLINAGLIPRLAENGYLYVYFRDYGDPLQQVRDYFRAHPVFAVDNVDQRSLLQILKSIRGRHDGQVVVIFDQFERFLVGVPPETRHRFLEEVRACLESDLSADELNLVFSLRDDFFGKLLLEAEAVIPSFGTEGHHHNLRTLDRAEARQAILGPLKDLPKIGFDIQFVDDILLPHLMRQAAGPSKIEPPHLQIVCNQLYESACERNRKQLDEGEPIRIGLELYEALGETAGMLRDYLEDVVHRVTAGDERQVAIVRSILKLMIATVGTRKFRTIAAICSEMPDVSAADIERIIGKLQDARVLEAKTAGTESEYSLSHEFMVAKVRSWYDEREMQRRKAVETVERSLVEYRSSGALLNQNQLDHLALWLSPERVTDDIRALLESSRQELDRQARHRKSQEQRVRFWKLGGVAVAGLLTAVSVAFGIWGSRNARVATLASQDFRRQARSSEARRLAAESQIARERFPRRALLLADAAVEATSEDGMYLATAEQSLRDALGLVASLPLPGRMLAHDPAGRQIATADDEGKIRVWSLDDLSQTKVEFSKVGAVTSLAVSPQWLVACDKNQGMLWSLQRSSTPPRPIEASRVVAMSPLWLVAEFSDTNALTGYRLLPVGDNPAGAPIVLGETIRWSDNRQWLATRRESGRVELWNLLRPGDPIEVAAPQEQAQLLAVGPTGRCLITISREAGLSPADAIDYFLTGSEGQGGRVPLSFKPRPGVSVLPAAGRLLTVAAVTAAGRPVDDLPFASFSADGRLVAASGDVPDMDHLFAVAADVRLWDIANPTESMTYAGHSAMTMMGFADDVLVTGGVSDATADSNIFVWRREEVGLMSGGIMRRSSLSASASGDQLRQVTSNYVVAQSRNHALRVWNVTALDSPPRDLYGLESSANSVVVDDTAGLLLASDDSGVSVWKLASLNLRREPQQRGPLQDAPRLLAQGSKGEVFVCGSSSFWLASLDEQRRLALRELLGSDPNSKFRMEAAQMMTTSSDGQWCLAVGGNFRAGVLVHRRGQAQWLPTIGGSPYERARFSQDDRWIVADGYNQSVVWKVGSRLEPVRFMETTAELARGMELVNVESGLAMIDDTSLILDSIMDLGGDWMLLSRPGGQLSLWNLKGEVPEIVGQPPAFLRQDKLQRLAGDDEWILFRVADALQLWDLSHPQDAPLNIAISGDGGFTPVEWPGVADERQLVLQVSPDNRWFVLASKDHYRLWRRADASLVPVDLDVPPSTLGHCRFTPDSRWLLAWNGRRDEFQAWRLDGDKMASARLLRGHSAGIRDVVGAVGDKAISTSDDGTMRLWNLTLPQWGSIVLNSDVAESSRIAITSDGESLLQASGTSLQAWRLWASDATGLERVEPLRKSARDAAGRPFSASERQLYNLPEAGAGN